MTPTDRKRLLLGGVRRALGDCTRCSLCKTRQNLVFDGGNPDAPIMVVAGTVTWEEDMTGTVLRGQHGELVCDVCNEIGLEPGRDLYATTVLKCQRPRVIKDGERTRADPEQAQLDECSKFLRWQISVVQPVIIVAHGKAAGAALFGESRSFGKYAGSWRQFSPTCVALATHNPAGLTFGERVALQSEFREHWRGLAEKLSCLGRLWKPDAACFQAGWSYERTNAA